MILHKIHELSFGDFAGRMTTPASRDRRRLPEKRMQRSGLEDGGSVYTESDRKVPNGSPG